MDYALIWAVLISIAVFAYVALDGFDLGVGILFPWFREEKFRDRMVNSVAPVWDGNETWLVLGGGGLLAVFPLAYSVLMPALYMPVIAMLLGLIFRGVAFEFRFKSRANKHWWDIAFMAGSMVATFCQGIMLGAMLQGIAVTDRAYSGGWFDWLSPFTIFSGLAVCVGYALLGATWLIMKTDGQLQGRAYRIAINTAVLLIIAIAGVSMFLVSHFENVADRWLNWPTSAALWLIPFLLAGIGSGLLNALVKKREGQPYWWALGVFFIAYLGFSISIFPYLVPFEITLWEAAGPDNSLAFLLAGAVVLLPIIFFYTGYVYWVFRGKVQEGDGYHD